jgi:hypothetical protein
MAMPVITASHLRLKPQQLTDHNSATGTLVMILCRVVLSMLSREMQRSAPLSKARRRSEIDRRLDSLVPAGRLKDSHTTTIVKVRPPCSHAQHFSTRRLQALYQLSLSPAAPLKQMQ